MYTKQDADMGVQLSLSMIDSVLSRLILLPDLGLLLEQEFDEGIGLILTGPHEDGLTHLVVHVNGDTLL